MRVSDTEKEAIINAIKEADPEGAIYLFGSRAHDSARGGDIDVLVLSETISFADKLQIKAKIFEQIEEQKVDLIVAKDRSEPFVKIAFQNSVELR